jgi:hypothetical protein
MHFPIVPSSSQLTNKAAIAVQVHLYAILLKGETKRERYLLEISR